MKIKYLFLIICILSSSITYAQNNTFKSLLNKYENEDDVIIVSMSKSMLKVVPDKIINGDVNLKNIVPKIESLLMIFSSKSSMKEKMSLEFKSLTDKNKNYEELIRIKDGKSNIIFNVNKQGDIIKELILLVNEETNFAAIQISGNFTIEDIQKITNNNTQ
jgi:hypothetical protein